MKTALIISTYNWPEALGAVLASLESQSVLPDRILIADDGSDSATEKLIDKVRKESGLQIDHVWQEDVGFRKSAVLNKAVARAEVDYVIQIDGDCIMHRDFIKDHLSRREDSTFLYGSRVNIKASRVEEVLRLQQTDFALFSRAIKNKSRNLRILPIQKLYKPKTVFSKKTRGCNLSYWREDFIAVNGYDETIEGWGREDSEFVLRLFNNGVKGKRLRYGGIVYHIYHPEKSRKFLERNSEIQKQTVQEKKVWCAKGVDRYL